jgi:hypothetical protein
MNRPFGAVDVAANLKGAVPKTATQKILVALAEKGELVQKTYGIHILLDAYIHWLWVSLDHAGKTTFFVANQANLEDMPVEKLKALEDEHKAIEEASKALVIEVKAVNTGRKMAKKFQVGLVICHCWPRIYISVWRTCKAQVYANGPGNRDSVVWDSCVGSYTLGEDSLLTDCDGLNILLNCTGKAVAAASRTTPHRDVSSLRRGYGSTRRRMD